MTNINTIFKYTSVISYICNMAFKQYLNFITSNFGRIELPFEAAGTDGVSFGIEQGSGRKGRDVMGAGSGDTNYKVTYTYGRIFEIAVAEWKRYGHQANIKFEVDYGDGIITIGNVDMLQFKYFYTYFTFVVIMDSELQRFKERYDTPVNLFSNKDLKGNTIEPCRTEKMLWKAKPLRQHSRWYTDKTEQRTNIAGDFPYIAIPGVLEKYYVDDSFVPYDRTEVTEPNAINEFVYINAKGNISDVSINVKANILFDYRQQGGSANSRASIELKYRIFYEPYPDRGTINEGSLYYKELRGTTFQQFLISEDFTVSLPNIPRGASLSIYWRFNWMSEHAGGAPLNSRTRWVIKEVSYDIYATNTFLNSVIDVVRYIDAINYTFKSSSGLNAIAERYDVFGDMYDTFITNAQLMRGLLERPLNLTSKFIIEEHVQPEQNGDYEIDSNGNVFVGGRWSDFYRDYECGEFFQELEKGTVVEVNQKYSINQFKLSYKNYATQKETTTENTLDTVHGSSTWLVDNDSVNNVREAEIGVVRDPFLIQDMIDKANEISDTAATNDDDKVVMIDAVEIIESIFYTENVLVQHKATTGKNLILKNDNTFSWLKLGLYAGGMFTIGNGANTGNYSILEITDQQLNLIRTSAGNPVDISELNTIFKYQLDPSVKYTARTSEGFTLIDGILNGNQCANLRYPLARLMHENYREDLATSIFYSKKPLKNTIYEYNEKAVTQFEGGEVIREGADYLPQLPVLTPMIYNLTLQMSFKEYWDLQNSIRTNRGYISTFDGNGNKIKGYLQKGEWTPSGTAKGDADEFEGRFKCTLEEKFEQFLLRIIKNSSTTTFNEKYSPSSYTFSSDEYGNFTIFDATGKAVFIDIPYDRIKVNGSGSANSTTELATWLKAIEIYEN